MRYERLVIAIAAIALLLQWGDAAIVDIRLGPAIVSLDPGREYFFVEMGEAVQDRHHSPLGDFDYTLYPATMSFSQNRIRLELRAMDEPIEATSDLLLYSLLESELAPWQMEIEDLPLDGRPGIVARGLGKMGQEAYAAAFSPTNRTILLVGSDLGEDESMSLFRSIRVDA
ncbi:MAG: hypothetical protein JW986_07715 [Methanotrichaceae archaeon]|nr:hypothetical protein [Methanotrichaceae archaeon]